MRINILDPIRFFAAFSVVFYHYYARKELADPTAFFHIAKFGYLGVPLFFIISGFVIALSAESRTPFKFAYYRFLRLYPAYWIAMIFTVLAVTILSESQYSLMQLLANATMLNDYLGHSDIDSVYWTLKAELKFYACMFLLSLTGLFKKYHYWLAVWTALSVLHIFTNQPSFMGWFVTPFYSPFFILGIIFFLIRSGIAISMTYALLAINSISAIIRAIGTADGFIVNPTTMDLWVVGAIITSMISFFYLIATQNIDIKKQQYLVTLGALTYPLYLIHNLAGKLLIDRLALFMQYEIAAFFVTILAIAISFILYKYLENPLVNWIKKRNFI